MVSAWTINDTESYGETWRNHAHSMWHRSTSPIALQWRLQSGDTPRHVSVTRVVCKVAWRHILENRISRVRKSRPSCAVLLLIVATISCCCYIVTTDTLTRQIQTTFYVLGPLEWIKLKNKILLFKTVQNQNLTLPNYFPGLWSIP